MYLDILYESVSLLLLFVLSLRILYFLPLQVFSLLLLQSLLLFFVLIELFLQITLSSCLFNQLVNINVAAGVLFSFLILWFDLFIGFGGLGVTNDIHDLILIKIETGFILFLFDSTHNFVMELNLWLFNLFRQFIKVWILKLICYDATDDIIRLHLIVWLWIQLLIHFWDIIKFVVLKVDWLDLIVYWCLIRVFRDHLIKNVVHIPSQIFMRVRKCIVFWVTFFHFMNCYSWH